MECAISLKSLAKLSTIDWYNCSSEFVTRATKQEKTVDYFNLHLQEPTD